MPAHPAPFRSQIILDVGLSTGDEGKGRLIPEIAEELRLATGHPDALGLVMKVNGGANAGHTVGPLKLNLIPGGAICPDVACLALGSGVVADPLKLSWEVAYAEHHGFAIHSRLLIDERTMVSDLSHRLLDLAWEYYRSEVLGEDKRGSTGRGITPAYLDEVGQFPLHYGDLRQGPDLLRRRLEARFDRALRVIQHVCRVPLETFHAFFDTLSEAEGRVEANREILTAGRVPASAFDFRRFRDPSGYGVDLSAIVEAYWAASYPLLSQIGDVRERLLATLSAGLYVIGEFGQAFWLDKRHGFAPNVTASHTIAPEFFLSAGIPLTPPHIFGVCKAYDTKVGTHAFPCRFPPDHPLGQKLSLLEFGTSTGRQRMVGWYDAVEKGDAIRYGGCDDVIINKLDALSYSGDWQGGDLLIGVGYTEPDGTRLSHVPRDPAVHRRVSPVYRQLPGWAEDISGVRTFDNLPLNAKRYVATAWRETLKVALGPQATWPAEPPAVRYIGVGPRPHQLIRQIPATRELLKLALPD